MDSPSAGWRSTWPWPPGTSESLQLAVPGRLAAVKTRHSMHDEVEIIDTLRRGEQAKALEMARAWVAAAPDNPQAQRLLALLLALTGDMAAAHATLDRAIALAPDDGSLHYQRADPAGGGEPLRRGERRTRSQHRRRPQRTARLCHAGADRVGSGRPGRSRPTARLAARVNPDHPWLLAMQGMVAAASPAVAAGACIAVAGGASWRPTISRPVMRLACPSSPRDTWPLPNRPSAAWSKRIRGRYGMRLLLVDADPAPGALCRGRRSARGRACRERCRAARPACDSRASCGWWRRSRARAAACCARARRDAGRSRARSTPDRGLASAGRRMPMRAYVSKRHWRPRRTSQACGRRACPSSHRTAIPARSPIAGNTAIPGLGRPDACADVACSEQRGDDEAAVALAAAHHRARPGPRRGADAS